MSAAEARRPRPAARLALLLAASLLLGCQQVYYRTMEEVGYHKREIMVDRVEDARDSQAAAKEQFTDALTQFGALVDYDGGDLEDLYDKLAGELEDSESRAEDVRDRIDAVEDVSKALFREWEEEIDQYSSPTLKASSERQLQDTRRQYEELMQVMRRAERKMDPVLAAFRDQVLFLKHNLNARAIASLQTELTGVEADIAALIRDMEASIAEADAFLETLGS